MPGSRLVADAGGGNGVARLEDEDIDEILRNEKPGFRRIQRARTRRERVGADADAGTAGDGGLELAELRRQYLGDEAEVLGDAAPHVDADDDDEPEDEVVIVEADARPGFETAPGRKTVIISGKERRIILEQG